MSLRWNIEECAAYHDRLLFRGWCHDPERPIVRIAAVFPDPLTVVPVVSFGEPSPDVADSLGPSASHCRFSEWLEVPPEAAGRDFYLRFFHADHRTSVGRSVLGNATRHDPFHRCWTDFLREPERLPGGTVLEIGSRARSAITRRAAVPRHLEYLGVDILPGPNVDVIGDVHDLGKMFSAGKFAAAFSFSVFEHLAMPWKVALELNRVLTPGGLVFTQTHQTWPMHEQPWDFWRFSDRAWPALFHAASGFEIIATASGEPTRIHPFCTRPENRDLPHHPAFLGSACIARKISGTDLAWEVPTETAARDSYPAGELTEAPR
jgi:SAM-dependent methyltransferase